MVPTKAICFVFHLLGLPIAVIVSRDGEVPAAPWNLKLLCFRAHELTYALFWQQMGNCDILLSKVFT